jgi:outer membrane lipopolysaccharide assembly protein LptE/RlpB
MNAATQRPHARARRVHPADALSRTLALGALALVAGCAFPIRLELATPADVTEWQRQITAAVNEHEQRLRALEQKE